jgi:hypothetical protein
MLREIADNLYPHPGRKRIGATPTRPRLLAGRPDSLHEDLGSRLAAWGGARFAGTAPLAGIAEHCRPTGYVEPTAEALASIGKALAAIGEEAGIIEWATHDQRFRSIKASAPEVRP